MKTLKSSVKHMCNLRAAFRRSCAGVRNSLRDGFTLIEVIVAMMILSISFVIVMQLFAGGLRSARTSCDYTRAVVLAKAKMEELSEIPVSESGEFEDGFRWESDIEPYNEPEEGGYNLVKLKVKVTWDDALRKSKSVELVSLKVVSDEENL